MRTFLALLAGLSVTFASQALAQSIPGPDPGGPAPGVSATGGKPLPVNPAEVRRDNTADPNSAPGASPTGGKPVPVDPAVVRRENAQPK